MRIKGSVLSFPQDFHLSHPHYKCVPRICHTFSVLRSMAVVLLIEPDPVTHDLLGLLLGVKKKE